jgi:(p)ppGpp synthase/HD superfamily hydrolase
MIVVVSYLYLAFFDASNALSAAPSVSAVKTRRGLLNNLVGGGGKVAAAVGVLKVASDLESRRGGHEAVLKRITADLRAQIAGDASVGAARIESRIKTPASAAEKLLRHHLPGVDALNDVAAVRVVLADARGADADREIARCYRVLANLEAAGRTDVAGVKHYVRFPKPNGYQSLHATCTPRDADLPRYEIQIRTARMHRVATEGSARHDLYKARP